MGSQNLISIEFPAADLLEINAFIAKIKVLMPAGMVTLTADERRAYLKMGDKTVAFVEKALDYGQMNSEIVPAYVNIAELKKDLEAVKAMVTILRKLEELTSMLDDSIILAGSEAYAAALSIYAATKDAAHRNVSGAKLAAEELKQRFPGRKPKDDSATV
jgi:FixJ family two-component response regulator